MADFVECINEDWGCVPLFIALMIPMPRVGQRFTIVGTVPPPPPEVCQCGKCFFYQLAEYPKEFIFFYRNFKPVDEHKRSTDTGFSILLDAAKRVELPAKPVKVPEKVDG